MTLDADAETILSALPDLLFRIAGDGTFLGYRAGDERQLFVPPDQIVGAKVVDLMPPEFSARVMEHIRAVLRGEGPQTFDYSLPVLGEERWYEARMVPGREEEVLVIIRDITAREHSERRFSSLVRDVDAIVWEGRSESLAFDFVSERARTILGYPEERWYEPGFWESRIHPDDREAVVRESREAARAGEDHRLEYRMLTADGRVVWLRDVVRVFGNGVCRGLMIDITERKELEGERRRIREQLLSSQKLESMGMLAGGIAHDFNNLLTAVIGNASLLLLRLPEDSPHRPLVEEIELAADRATALTRQILAYSGKGTFDVRRIDVGETIQEIAPLLQTSISTAVTLTLDLAPELPAILGDPSQIQQVVMNLAINGAEALEGRPGRVRVTTREVTVDAALADTFDVGAEVAPGRYVRIEVNDDGNGIAGPILRKVLDPFFTTKPTGRGLGLAAVVGIVRSHAGGLRVSSCAGHGSTFAVYLRAVDGGAEQTAAPVAHGALEGRGLVLVVDDEPSLRGFISDALSDFGYEVEVAPDGLVGLERFRELKDRVSLVVMDMTMPVMSGEESFRAMRALDPELRALLVSGYDEEEATRRFTADGLAGFLQKPFTATRLAAKIRELLDR
ncbi:MAG: response regulator [Sandaracinaceae bacterium]|nr:response regulator [Sandaracinaceae bacterium]